MLNIHLNILRDVVISQLIISKISKTNRHLFRTDRWIAHSNQMSIKFEFCSCDSGIYKIYKNRIVIGSYNDLLLFALERVKKTFVFSSN